MILNRQRRVRVSVAECQEFFRRVRRALKLPAESLTVCFVTDSQIARWNRAYRGKNRPTDVLSFPADRAGPPVRNHLGDSRKDTPPNRHFRHYLGDVAIAPAVARRNARRFGRTLPEELRLLILHGTLHLMGYDHETDSGQMDRRERILRRKLGLA